MVLPLNQARLTEIFATLGKRIKSMSDEEREELEIQVGNENPWFTKANINLALEGVAEYLNKGDLDRWCEPLQYASDASKIGLLMAGNIPLVGFHDLIAVVLSGNVATLKLSSKDSVLIQFVLDQLMEIEPEISQHIEVVDKLTGIDAVIATGSDNSARYFEYYFGKYPNIIRKNRSSVAVLSGDESEAELTALGEDIFSYFGLGCRNVSKIYVPEGYSFTSFYDAIEQYSFVIHHHKYNNNYDYNKSVLLINSVKHLDNGFLLIRESETLVSPISVVFYESYADSADLEKKLGSHAEKIQCIVGRGKEYIPFGQAQRPTLWDFADGVDTRQFLNQLTFNNEQ